MQHRYGVQVQWSNEDEAFVASSPEFPGLTGVEPDQDAAIGQLREAIDMALDVMAEEGTPPPEPMTRQQFSGQFRLRIRRSAHAALTERANLEGVSLNALVASYVEAGLAGPAGAAMQRTRATVVRTAAARQ